MPTVEIPVWPSIRSSVETTHSSSTNTVTAETVNVPAQVQAGDLLVLYTVMDAGTLADLTPPPGFTQLGELLAGTNLVAHSVAYKVAGASEPSTYTYGRLSASTDGASLMVAIRDWDGNTANLRYSQQLTTRTTRAIPAVTPATGHSLVLHSGHHDADSSSSWGWHPPDIGGTMVGVSRNASGWSGLGVASFLAEGTSEISGRTWATSTLPATATNMISTSLTIGAGSATRTAQIGPKSGGSGGALTDTTNNSFTANSITGSYHLYAADLDWSRDVGLLIYTDGSGEYGLLNPSLEYLLGGPRGLIATAKRHNMVLLTPMAPGGPCADGDGVCWYDTSPSTSMSPNQKLAWSKALIEDVFTKYNLDRSRVAYGGYSSGAQWTTQYWGPAHAHEVMTDGVAVAIGYGGPPKVVNTNTPEFKANVPITWNVGVLDNAWRQPTWDDSIQQGIDVYSPTYETALTLVGGLTHDRYVGSPILGEFGGIMDRAIVQYIRPSVSTALEITWTTSTNASELTTAGVFTATRKWTTSTNASELTTAGVFTATRKWTTSTNASELTTVGAFTRNIAPSNLSWTTSTNTITSSTAGQFTWNSGPVSKPWTTSTNSSSLTTAGQFSSASPAWTVIATAPSGGSDWVENVVEFTPATNIPEMMFKAYLPATSDAVAGNIARMDDLQILDVTNASGINGSIVGTWQRNAAGEWVSQSLDASSGITEGTVGTPQLGPGVVTTEKLYANAVTAEKLAAGAIAAGSAIIADAAIRNAQIADATIEHAKISSVDAATITVNKLTGNQIDANTITANHITADAVDTTKLTADAIDGMTITGATFKTGPETGQNTVISPSGIVFSAKPTGEVNVRQVAQMGTAYSAVWSVFNASNEVIAGTTTDGHVVARSVQGEDVMLMGNSLLNYFNNFPRGQVAFVEKYDAMSTNAAEQIYVRLKFRAEAGRLYRIMTSSINYKQNGGEGVGGVIRFLWQNNGGTVTSASAEVERAVVTGHAHDFENNNGPSFMYHYDPTVSEDIEVGIGFVGTSASTLTIYNTVFSVEDMGPSMPATVGIRRKTTWVASASALWRKDTSVKVSSTKIQQGLAATWGNVISYLAFTNAAAYGDGVGKMLSSEMTGATILSAKLSLHNQSTNLPEGATAVAAPTTHTSTTTLPPTPTNVIEKSVAPGAWVSIDITSLWTNLMRGITLGGRTADADNLFSAIFHNTSSGGYRPQLEIEYTRSS